MSGPEGRERRKLKRVVKRIPVRFETDSIRGQGHIKNLSKEGLFIRCNLLPASGEAIRVTFETREGEKIQIKGSVCWTTAQIGAAGGGPHGFGVYLERRGPAFSAFFESLLLR